MLQLTGARAEQDAARIIEESQASLRRWAYLTEGIKNPRDRALVSILLDNQKRAGLFEDDTTGDIPTFTTIALAFVPKVYPALLLNRIASVQPLMGPTGKVFFEDFVSDSPGNTSFTHGEVAAITDPAVAETCSDTGSGSTLPTGNLYGAYTWLTPTGETKLSPISTSTAITATHKFRFASRAFPTGVTGRNFYLSVSPDSTVLKYVGTQAAAANFDVSAMPVSGALDPPSSNTTSPAVGEGATIPKARYKLTASTVTAQKWALQVQWTTELQEDLRAQYNQDLQSMVFNYVAREIIGNIDYTALNTIFAGIPAPNQVSWSKAAAAGYTQRDWDQSIYGAIVDASLAVEKARFRHPDYIVCSPAFAARLEKLETFKAVGWPVGRDDEIQTPGNIGTNVFGSISGRWTVYRSPHIGEGTGGYGQAFVGIHGEGFIYAPYIPIQLGPILPIPNTDELARTMRTRAGMIQTLTNAFGSVTVTA